MVAAPVPGRTTRLVVRDGIDSGWSIRVSEMLTVPNREEPNTRQPKSPKHDDRGHTGWYMLSDQPDELERERLDFRRAGRSRASQGSSMSSHDSHRAKREDPVPAL